MRPPSRSRRARTALEKRGSLGSCSWRTTSLTSLQRLARPARLRAYAQRVADDARHAGRARVLALDVADRRAELAAGREQVVEVAADHALPGLVAGRDLQPLDLGQPRWQQALLEHARDVVALEVGEAAGLELAARGVVQVRVLDRERGERRDGDHEPLRVLAEDARPLVAEEQPAEHVAVARLHGHGEVGAHRQMALRHPVVGRAAAVARVGGDVVAADHAGALEGRVEDGGVARHREALERGPRDAGDRVEHVRLAARVEHVVEERPELRARQRGALLGDALDDVLELALGHQRGRDPVQAAGRAVLRSQAGLGDRRLALVVQPRDRAADAGGDELERGALLRRQRHRLLEGEVEHADGAEAVLDLDLDPAGRGGPGGIAGRDAEALAPRSAARRRRRRSARPGGRAGDRAPPPRAGRRRPGRARPRAAPAIAARHGGPCRSELPPPLGGKRTRRRQRADPFLIGGALAFAPGGVVESPAMRLPLLIAAALLALPATAAAAPPPNDNYLASTTISSQEYRDSVDTTEATTQPDLFNPNRDGLPFGGGDPEPDDLRRRRQLRQDGLVGLQAAEPGRRADPRQRRLRRGRRDLHLERVDLADHPHRPVSER